MWSRVAVYWHAYQIKWKRNRIDYKRLLYPSTFSVSSVGLRIGQTHIQIKYSGQFIPLVSDQLIGIKRNKRRRKKNGGHRLEIACNRNCMVFGVIRRVVRLCLYGARSRNSVHIEQINIIEGIRPCEQRVI